MSTHGIGAPVDSLEDEYRATLPRVQTCDCCGRAAEHEHNGNNYCDGHWKDFQSDDPDWMFTGPDAIAATNAMAACEKAKR